MDDAPAIDVAVDGRRARVVTSIEDVKVEARPATRRAAPVGGCSADGRASAPRASVARLLPLGASSRRLTLTESFVDDDARVETFLDECEARADARGGGLWDVLPTRARAALGPEATDDARAASASASEEALRVDADARGRLRLGALRRHGGGARAGRGEDARARAQSRRKRRRL